jgi:hypothetical protein
VPPPFSQPARDSLAVTLADVARYLDAELTVCLFGSRRKVDRFSRAWVKLTELAEAIRPLMSALPPIPTELMHHNEPSLRANRVLMHSSKKQPYSITSSARSKNDSGIVSAYVTG